eukprot:6459053-Amphidinium_carterae.1
MGRGFGVSEPEKAHPFGVFTRKDLSPSTFVFQRYVSGFGRNSIQSCWTRQRPVLLKLQHPALSVGGRGWEVGTKST